MTQPVAERIAIIELWLGSHGIVGPTDGRWLITELRAALARVEAVEGIASGLRERINVALDRAEAAEAALARARDALMDFAAGCDDLMRNCGPEITKGEQRTWRAMAAKLRNAALKEP